MARRGVLYMALSAFGFSLMSLLVKLVSPRLPVGELVLARAVFTLVLSFAMVRRAGVSLWGHQRGKLVVRGLVGSAALAFYYLALVALSLPDATTLQYTQPLLTSLLAWWLLGEAVGWSAAFAIACGIGGVLLVMHPGMALGATPDTFGVICGIASAVLSAIAYVTVRQLSRTEHPLVIVFYFSLVTTPLAVPWAVYHSVWPTPIEWLALVGIGVSTQVGQVFLTRGLAVEKAGRAVAVGYLQICFAAIWQLLVFGQIPALGTMLGAALVIGGTLAVSLSRTSAVAAERTPT